MPTYLLDTTESGSVVKDEYGLATAVAARPLIGQLWPPAVEGLTGQTGPKGDTGPTGPVGPTGPAGPAGTLAAFSPARGTESQHNVTSTTFVDVASYQAVTFTVGPSGAALISFPARVQSLANAVGVLGLSVDGVDVGNDGLRIVETGASNHVVQEVVTGLSAGTHTARLRARVTGGNMVVTGGNRERPFVIPLG